MNKLQGRLVAGLSVAAFFGVVGSAHAQGQSPYAVPAQPPMMPAQPPMMQAQPPMMQAQPPMMQAQPPMPQAPVMEAQPQWAPPPPMMPPPPVMAAAPKVSDDMTGSLGFGLGVGTGATTTSLVSPDTRIYVRYWFNDSLSILPSMQLKLYKHKGDDVQWGVAPSTQLVYCPWKTASTRFAIGGGIGMAFSRWAGGDLNAQPAPNTKAPSNTTIEIYVPISAGVEHFFAKWFSMGVLITDRLVTYRKLSSDWDLSASIDNTKSLAMVGFLFFYTD